jgi:hypothetical protein
MLPLSAGSAARIAGWLLAFGLILFPHCAAGQSLPENLFQRWIHSYEEDTSEAQVFRPSGYSFPPARGRVGFEIRADGSFILLGPGGNDRSTAVTGHWVRSQDWTLQVTFSDSHLNREIHILEVKPQILRIRR